MCFKAHFHTHDNVYNDSPACRKSSCGWEQLRKAAAGLGLIGLPFQIEQYGARFRAWCQKEKFDSLEIVWFILHINASSRVTLRQWSPQSIWCLSGCSNLQVT
jgi:hypothetical protein